MGDKVLDHSEVVEGFERCKLEQQLTMIEEHRGAHLKSKEQILLVHLEKGKHKVRKKVTRGKCRRPISETRDDFL